MKSAHPVTEVDEALRRCAILTRRKARNFYYGMKLAPEPKRSALYVLYAWMREADDIVDGEAAGDRDATSSSLERFARLTDAALEGTPADDPPRSHLWPGLRFLAERFHVSPQHFRAMIEGQLRDLRQREYESFDDLREYCMLVASSVGLLCLEIWGARQEDLAQRLAVDRGLAFQLTNILRDFAEDYDEGRVYLPAEEFREHSITPQQLRAWSEPARCARFVRSQSERAREFYERSANLEDLVEPDCRPVLQAMTAIYVSILGKIEAHPERIVRGRRAGISPFRKAWIAARAARSARRVQSDARAQPRGDRASTAQSLPESRS